MWPEDVRRGDIKLEEEREPIIIVLGDYSERAWVKLDTYPAGNGETLGRFLSLA